MTKMEGITVKEMVKGESISPNTLWILTRLGWTGTSRKEYDTIKPSYNFGILFITSSVRVCLGSVFLTTAVSLRTIHTSSTNLSRTIFSLSSCDDVYDDKLFNEGPLWIVFGSGHVPTNILTIKLMVPICVSFRV